MAGYDSIRKIPIPNRNKNLERMGSMETVCERILTTYVDTGRSVRSLAALYRCSKSTIGRYIKDYAEDLVPYSLYKQGRLEAKLHLEGRANDTDEVGELD